MLNIIEKFKKQLQELFMKMEKSLSIKSKQKHMLNKVIIEIKNLVSYKPHLIIEIIYLVQNIIIH